ncbi:MAG: hypothetical protein ACFCBW_04140 [Candidatus Competibacterales bacterium]
MNTARPSVDAAALTRLLQLQADGATEGLGPVEQAELAELLARYPQVDPRGLDRAAAAVDLAHLGGEESLPRDLALRIAAAAPRHLPTAPPGAGSAVAGRGLGRGRFPRPSRGVPWALAASLGVAVVGFWLLGVLWWTAPGGLAPPAAPSPATVVARFEARHRDTVAVPLRAPQEPMGQRPVGELLWSAKAQGGYLRLTGLGANDPRRSQYQLWLVDRRRPGPYPVDGGVFDVPAGIQETLVAIRPALRVLDLAAVAITREPPGGVVVSEGAPVVATANLPANSHDSPDDLPPGKENN